MIKHSPGLGFGLLPPDSQPDQFVVRLDPAAGVQLLLVAQHADVAPPEPIELGMEFAQAGGEGPTPCEVLLHAAMIGRNTRSPGRTPSRRPGGSCSR